ncbi:MAG: amino acid adenylation domain-containing protein [Bacteroidota bacterium]
MKTIDLLARLKKLNIKLRVEEGNLKINAPKGALTAELQSALKEHKAELIDFLNQIDAQVTNAPIPRAPDSSGYALSSSQRRLWILDQMGVTGAAYNLGGYYKLSGALDEARFIASIESLVRRHEILRTVFKSEGTEVRQVVLDADQSNFSVERVDLPNASDNDLEELVSEERSRLFDLATGPLLHARLVRLGGEGYLFLITLHHIISDGWSVDVMIKELIQLYQGNALPELPIQYKDYAGWQQSQLTGKSYDRARAYWHGQFSGDIPVLELSTVYKRPKEKTYNGDTASYQLPLTLKNSLNDFSQKQGASLFMTLLSITKLLCYRYTGQEDLTIGTAVAGRNHKDLEKQLGFYVNTLALRSHITPDWAFTDLLEAVKKTVLDAQSYEHYPFDALVDELDLARDLSRNPLFDVMVVMQNTTVEDALNQQLGGIQVSAYGDNTGVSKFDMTINFTEVEDGLALEIEYNTDLFDQAWIDRFASHYTQLASAVTTSDQAIATIDYINEEEKALLQSFNATAKAYAPATSIHQSFETQVAKTPNATALTDAAGTLDYKTLNGRSNQIAHQLIASSIGKGDIVAVMMGKCNTLLISMLGILKSGAAYVPVDPTLPQQRIAGILSDSKSKAVLAVDQENIPEGYTGHVIIPTEGYDKYPTENPNKEISTEDTAYLMYTSGTTGQPKGVLVSHRSVLNLNHWLGDIIYNPYPAPLTALLTANISFDASVQQLFPPLLHGGKLVLVEEETKQDINRYRKQVIDHGVDVLDITPGYLNALLASQPSGNKLNVGYTLVGGEALSNELAGQYEQGFKAGSQLINVYGVTEATVDSTYEPVSKDRIEGSIGKPIPNTSIYILDDQQNQQPVGAWGEIAIAGTGVALGYHQRDELNAARFVQNPGSEENIYLTGDIGRWLPDGTIEFKGRVDTQVKLRGYRIELGEIEHHLQGHDDIALAAVIVSGEGDDKQLVAYYSGTEQTTQDLKQYLSGHIPAYMVPAYYHHLDKMPMTSSGKVDRKQLPDEATDDSASAYVAPRTATEEQLAKIWSDILGKEQVGIHDNFFALGGHSLKAIRLCAAVFRQMDKTINIKDVFGSPTVAELTEVIESGTKTKSAIPKIVESELYDLSIPQYNLWMLSQMDVIGNAYNLTGGYEFSGALDEDQFVTAVKQLVQRHEVLRTSFVMEDSKPKQKIHDFAACGFEVVRLDWSAQNDTEEKVQQMMAEEKDRPFDLMQGPLISCHLIKLADDKFFFIVSLHHIISDGWSVEVMLKEIISSYKGDKLQPLNLQYKDYAAWQLEQQEEGSFQESRNFWLEQFSGDLPVLELPTSYPRPKEKNFKGHTKRYNLGSELTHQLKDLSAGQNTSLFTVLLSMSKVLLYRYTGQDDIIIGTAVAGRNHSDLEDQIGFYVNTIALRTQLQGSWSFVQLLEAVKSTTLNAYTHEDYPFDALVEELNITRDLSRSPLFDIMIEMQSTAEIEDILTEQLDGVQVKEYSEDDTVSKFDVMIYFWEKGNDIVMEMEYDTALFSEEWVDRFAHHFTQLADHIVADIDKGLNDYAYLSHTEQDKLSGQFNQNQSHYDIQQTIQGLFEAQVKETPDANAVIYDGLEMSYQTLNEKANQLAHYLLAETGISKDDTVVVIMDRSDKMIIALLGILKSGGAYVPIDPSIPTQRRQHILKDTQPKAILTETDYLFDIEATDAMIFAMDIQMDTLETSSANPDMTTAPDALAYIIYTSGSTGMPKGVCIQHNQIANTLFWRQEYYQFGTGDVNLQIPSFAFDSSVEDIFSPLISGGTLLIPKESMRVNAEYLKTLILNHEVTHFLMVPSLYNVIVDEVGNGLAGMKAVTVAGEALKQDLLRKHMDTVPDVRLINEYGPTENAVCSTVLELKSPEDHVTIGGGISNVKVYILDGSLNMLPIGVPGEICVSGPGLARGYLNNDSLTQTKFVANPYASDDADQRLYRTGDMGRFTETGEIEFLGREDGQIKIRGYRVELGEIENTLSSYELVKDAVVEVRYMEDTPVLVAYLLNTEGLRWPDVKKHLATELPYYMVPQYGVLLDEFPVTNTGKIDRKSLPDPDFGASEFVEAENDLERIIVEVWQEVLVKKQIGIYDDFFSAGGDSIKAIQICSRILNQGYKLTVGEIFQYKTPAMLAQVMQPVTKEIDQRTVTGKVALGPIQKEFFYGEDEDRHHFNQAVILKADKASVDKEIMHQVLVALQNHHDMLRTTFNQEEGESVQTVHDLDFPVSLEEYDLMNTLTPDQEFMTLANELQGQIDMVNGPLMKVALCRLPDQDKVIITVHHLVVDGVSWRILLEDIDQLYDQIRNGEQAKLPLKTESFATWSDKINTYSEKEGAKDEMAYWDDIVSHEMPSVQPEVDVRDNLVKDTSTISFKLSTEQTHALLTKANEAFNTEINDLLLTALGLAIKDSFGISSCGIAMESHGRENEHVDLDVSRTVGWFTTVYPVILDVKHSDDEVRLLKEVKEMLRKIPNKGTGFGALKYSTNDTGRTKKYHKLVPELSFNYLGQFDAESKGKWFAISDEPIENQVSGNRSREHLIDVSGMVIEGCLDMSVTYNKRHFESTTAQSFCENFRKRLNGIITLCSTRKSKEVTPSDLGYKSLSIEEIDNFFD